MYVQNPHDAILHIDGSQGEGGGQILRTSLLLSALTQRPIRIENIRSNRDKPGLRPQHLTGVVAMGQLCDAELSGATLGSDALYFAPSSLPEGSHSIDIRTAGSTSLLFHALCFGFAFNQKGGGSLELRGGTHADRAPTFDYLQHVWAPLMRLLGFQFDLTLEHHGFYPKGGGCIHAEIAPYTAPTAHTELSWNERPALDKVEIHALWAEPNSNRKQQRRSAQIPQRMAQSAQALLKESSVPVETYVHQSHSASPGAVCHIFGHFGPLRAGWTVWGARGVRSEKIGQRVARDTLDFLNTDACIDEHAADQILLPLALTGRDASFTTPVLSGHLKTHADILQLFLPQLKITCTQKSPHLTEVFVRHKSNPTSST